MSVCTICIHQWACGDKQEESCEYFEKLTYTFTSTFQTEPTICLTLNLSPSKIFGFFPRSNVEPPRKISWFTIEKESE